MWPQVRTRACASPLPPVPSFATSRISPARARALAPSCADLVPPVPPPQSMMNPYGTAGQVMYPGYMVRLPLSRLQGDRERPPKGGFRALRATAATARTSTAREETTFTNAIFPEPFPPRTPSDPPFPPIHRRATTRRRLPARTARRLARATRTASAATPRRSGSSSTRRRRRRRRLRRRRRTAAPRRPPPARRGPATGTPGLAKCGWTSAS